MSVRKIICEIKFYVSLNKFIFNRIMSTKYENYQHLSLWNFSSSMFLTFQLAQLYMFKCPFSQHYFLSVKLTIRSSWNPVFLSLELDSIVCWLLLKSSAWIIWDDFSRNFSRLRCRRVWLSILRTFIREFWNTIFQSVRWQLVPNMLGRPGWESLLQLLSLCARSWAWGRITSLRTRCCAFEQWLF